MAKSPLPITTFFAPSGDPLSYGYILLRINTDGSVAGTQICGGFSTRINLDENGQVVGIPLLWPNDEILPAGSVYLIEVYSAEGQQISETYFSIGESMAVSSVFARIGAVVAANGDYSVSQVTGAAPLASPALTGTPTAPTASSGTNTTQLATTAFVKTAVAGGGVVSSVFTRTGAVVASSGDYSVAQVTGAAPIASPTFTGTPEAPTAAPGTNTTQLATTAFSKAAVAVETTRAEGAEALLAPIANPTFTGAVTAPTINNLSIFQSASGDNQNFGGSLPTGATGADSTGVGNGTLSSLTSGNSNVAVGYSALYAGTTCQQDVAVGVSALAALTTAADCVAVGTEALLNLTTGNSNTAVGQSAGTHASPILQTIANCTFIGYEATATVDGISNSTAIGNGAQVSASNQVAIGNSSVTTTVLHGTVSIPKIALGTGAQTIYTGSGAPSGPQATGSIYVNTTGASGSLLYVYTGSAWVAFA